MTFTPKDRPDLSPVTRRKLPVKYNEKHEEAFQIYLELGPERSHRGVAKKLGVSHITVGNWATAYNWAKRLENELAKAKSVGLKDYFGKISNIRNDGIAIVGNVMGLFREITETVETARKEGRELTEKESAKLVALRGYLDGIGLRVNTAGDLRNLINAVGDIFDFQPGSLGGGYKAEEKKGDIHVQGPCLIIQGLDQNVKEMIGDNKMPALRGGGTDNPNGG